MALHRDTATESVHIIHAWAVADTTARDALTLASSDIGRVARVGSSAPYTFYVLTNNTGPAWVNIGATGSSIDQGKHVIWLPAAAMRPTITTGAASGSFETTTYKNTFSTLDFDTASVEFGAFAIQMPKSWDESTITFKFVWSHAATTTNFGVAFGLQAGAFSNDDTLDAALSAVEIVTDTGGTTDDIYVSAESAAFTPSGTPAAEDYVHFHVSRQSSNAGDTMAIDARLHGVTVFYTINAATDA